MKDPIPRRQLGERLQVSAVGLGCMGMSDFYGHSDEANNLEVLHRAVDIGINFFDTADMYGMGANERLLAKILKTRRSEIVVATKFGIMRAPTGERLGINGRPEYVTAACDASLARLGVDHIDLYYQHRVDPTVPIEETVGAMARLVEAGKVHHLGLSEVSGATLRRAHRVHRITAVQTEYSLWTRDVEQDALPVCRELGVGFVPYSPLGRGFLTGAIQNANELDAGDWRRTNPRFEAENLRRNRSLVEAVSEIASSLGCTPAQLALAWLLHQGPDIVPIPGTRRTSRLDENAAATRLALKQSDLERINAVVEEIPVAGTRYISKEMGSVNL